jgi:NADH:ubiquinone oxidoreductase subunit D
MKRSLLNIGPQHPAVHGVLRIIIELSSESITKISVEIGYLHRGTEKLSEYSEYYKILPFFDRLDYTGLILCEHSYILSVEKLINYNINLEIQLQRIILNELMRISSHFLALTTSAMDIGAVTPFL